ncbi:hypothetical protein C8R43DRAFT_1141187 [Mycena crocata]|nr:hypothetical protein C8R43DRAFT_1141187 [Mycena crocata]
MLLRALPLVLIHRFLAVSGATCDCSSVLIPIQVDVLVPKNTSDEFAGLKSNSTDLRRVDATYDIYGVFCRPDVPGKNADSLQLLVHGFSYTNQYWSPPVEEFRNYSYSAFSCDRGLSSLAIDTLGAGLTTRREDPSEVQPFKKIIAVGHSMGSGLLNFGAIVDGAQSPFDALVLTGHLITGPDDATPGSGSSAVGVPARVSNPARWGSLDPGYITIEDRSFFYPVDPTAFSPRIVLFDEFTKDVGTASMLVQAHISSLSVENYQGSVVKVIGSEDQFCPNPRCADPATLAEAEGVVWPAAKSFELVVSQGNGHDMNLDFAAGEAFSTIFDFVDKFSA